VPTGGVAVDQVEDYLAAGAVALGVGSNLVDRRAIAERDWRRLTTLAQSFRESVDHARQVIVKKGRARVSR
jgi:2-dehydro-3-deoxyphosphogluconate aldolase/(4S)-4-hydroxy-2-oxoglutarate aldolase